MISVNYNNQDYLVNENFVVDEASHMIYCIFITSFLWSVEENKVIVNAKKLIAFLIKLEH